MDQTHRKGLQALGQLLLELVLVMPAILIIALYLSPEWSNMWLGSAIVTGSALMALIIQSVFHFKKEGLWLTLFFMCAAVFYFSTGSPDDIKRLILYLISYTAFARGFKVASSQEQASAYSMIYACGLAVHAILFLVSMFLPEWRQLQPLLAVLGLIALFSVMFLLNRKQLGRANYSDMNRVSVPLYVLRMNRRYVVIFLGSIFIIATLLFSSMMDGLWRLFRELLNALLSKENEPLQEPEIDRPEDPFEFLPTGGEQSTHPIWIWLEKIVGVVVSIILICGAILLILWLFRSLIRRWFPRLWEALRRLLTQERAETPDMDYKDEHFSLLKWDKLKKELKLPLNNLFQIMKRKPERMSDYHTNRERIRFLYRSKVREAEASGYELQPSLTPKQTLEVLADRSVNSDDKKQMNQLTSLYNTARYSEEEIKDDQVQSLLQASKNKK